MPSATNPLFSYERLQSIFYEDVRGEATRRALEDCFVAAVRFLTGCGRVALKTPKAKRRARSGSPEGTETLAHEHAPAGKTYFAFSHLGKLSRPVNRALYSRPSARQWRLFTAALDRGDLRGSDTIAAEITKLIYSIAISFCCSIDLLKERDQQRPGTFFAYLISHLVAARFGVNPARQLPLVDIETDSHLPTDFTFDVPQPGRRRRFHLPIKTSTRERAIQIFAHQAMLDKAHGQRIFAAIPVILGETKTDRAKREVIEICLPRQWQLYQRYLAPVVRAYYLDVPEPYRRLSSGEPPLVVKEFGEFFFEADDLKP